MTPDAPLVPGPKVPSDRPCRSMEVPRERSIQLQVPHCAVELVQEDREFGVASKLVGLS